MAADTVFSHQVNVESRHDVFVRSQSQLPIAHDELQVKDEAAKGTLTLDKMGEEQGA